MMTTLTIWVLAGLIVLAFLLVRRGGRPDGTRRHRFWITAMKIGGAVALLRVAILWYLASREWSGTQSLSLLPLILALYPEGFLLRSTWTVTAAHVWLFSGLLAVGSMMMTVVVALGARALGRSGHAP